MSKSETTPQKRTDDESTITRSYHAVPADWVRLGHHQHVLEGYERFYAAKLCYEHRLETDPDAVGGVVTTDRLYVLYRKPGTTEAVERTYRATVVETTADYLTVTTGAVDGDVGPDNWGRLEYAAVVPTDDLAVVPKVVFEGEPRNFRASVAVSHDEPRLGEGR